MAERLQKILAQAGYGSRRASEEFISAGRVRVNGEIATLGQKADPTKDKITVDGKPLAAAESLTYIALYKPRNVLSTVESRNIFINRLPETLEITHCGLFLFGRGIQILQLARVKPNDASFGCA